MAAKVIFILYQIAFRADTKSYPVLSVNTFPICDSLF